MTNPDTDSYGNKFWHQEGKLHRLDAPAIEYANRNKLWYQEGKLHRLDGPAVEYASGTREWWINGEKVDPFYPIGKTQVSATWGLLKMATMTRQKVYPITERAE